MADYQVPLQDMRFILDEVFDMSALWAKLPKLDEGVEIETAHAILDECAKIAEQEIAPLSREGDEVGVSFSDGVVTTAPGYKAAWDVYCEGGWSALGGDPEFGGMGMPKVITAFHEEMLCGSDISFSLYPGLTAGAALSVLKHASEELKALYLPRMYSGEWAASMCLTEAHAGSDLGIIRTKAVPQEDGSYAVTGSKIFITGGEHDLTDNIIHLVLAKLPDAPAGSRGISLFIVPKFKVDADGNLGEANGVSCGSIEHKMGIHASATCVMNFDDAQGYLVGEVNKGLACMFTMMNFERIGVGIQGIGAASKSYQSAREYAFERLQGRAVGGAKLPEKEADPLTVHGDVRRMLLNMKALTEGSRAFSAYISMQLDMATYGEGELQQRGEVLSALLTPVAKAFFTDLGFESTVTGQQVFGGHGFIREWGQEQLVRDCRIAQIYEGTNGIQAMDLLARKVFPSKGESLKLFLGEITSFANQLSSSPLAEFAAPLNSAVAELTELTEHLLAVGAKDFNELGTAANDYLHVVGYTGMAYIWARMALASVDRADEEFYGAKVATARYYFECLLPRRTSLIAAIKAGAAPLFDFDDSYF